MLKYLNEWIQTERGKLIINDWVLDKEGVLSYKNYNELQGVYSIDVLECSSNTVINLYVGEIGEINNAKSYVAQNIPDRILQHLKAWCGNGYTEYWTGVSERDLNSGKYKFTIQILQIENDYKKRKSLESKYITLRRPLLQYSCYKKWNSKYDRPDLCIIPFNDTRKKAFLEKLQEVHPETDYVRTTNLNKNWLSISKLKKPSNEVVERISSSIEKNSKLHKKVKEKLDNEFGFNVGSRGCTYNFIVTLLAKAYILEMNI